MNRGRALVTGGTKKDVNAMAVLALNIKAKCPDMADELVVYHNGISKEIQDLFNRIMPTRFIRYRCPIPKLKLWQNRTVRYFSSMVFCKIECFRLLEEYETVIWSDYDVLIKADISEILVAEEQFSFVYNHDIALKDMFHERIKNINMDEFEMDGSCLATPIFVLRRGKIDCGMFCDWGYQVINRIWRYLYLPEQCIFTMLAQHFALSYNELDIRTYVTHPKDDAEDVKILHAYGQPKFWNGLENKEWNDYYKQWNLLKRGLKQNAADATD